MNAPTAIPSPKAVPPYKHTPLFPLGKDKTPYRKISRGRPVETVMGKEMLVVSREALRAAREAAFGDINHYLRPGHLQQLRNILDDKEASDNDKFVAFDFLKNANIAAGGVLPMCQDTGTAIIMGKKGARHHRRRGRGGARRRRARRVSAPQPALFAGRAALDVRGEEHANNMPAQCEIYAEGDDAYKFMFMAKGGGSANKSFLFQARPRC
jgi:fumarate hydratase class I